MKTKLEIYNIVYDYSLKLDNLKNNKLIPYNFKIALSNNIITENEYDFYFDLLDLKD